MTADPHRILVVSSAVRAAIAAAAAGMPAGVAASIAVAEILAHDNARADGVRRTERPVERRERENAAALEQVRQLEAKGRARSACAIVARRLAADPGDPREVEALAKHIRRLRRRHKE